MQESLFRHSYHVVASDLNQYGIMHGGRLMTLCDEVAYISARQHADSICLTRAVHRARFHQAVHEGETIVISARVGLTGHSSLWVPVEVAPEQGGRPVMDAVFVFAAIDENRNAVAVPAITAGTEEEKQLQIRLQRMKSLLNQTA